MLIASLTAAVLWAVVELLSLQRNNELLNNNACTQFLSGGWETNVLDTCACTWERIVYWTLKFSIAKPFYTKPKSQVSLTRQT